MDRSKGGGAKRALSKAQPLLLEPREAMAPVDRLCGMSRSRERRIRSQRSQEEVGSVAAVYHRKLFENFFLNRLTQTCAIKNTARRRGSPGAVESSVEGGDVPPGFAVTVSND